jgi:hypothetical protein
LPYTCDSRQEHWLTAIWTKRMRTPRRSARQWHWPEVSVMPHSAELLSLALHRRTGYLTCFADGSSGCRHTKPRFLFSPAEKAHDSRGMDVMGTLDLSIQGWFINPDDIVRTFYLLLVALHCCLATWCMCASLRAALSVNQHSIKRVMELNVTCRKYANERTAVIGCWEQVLLHC